MAASPAADGRPESDPVALLTSKGIDRSERAVALSTLLISINKGRMSLLELVQQLQSKLISEDSAVRRLAVELLSDVVERLPKLPLGSMQVKTVGRFFVDKLEDWVCIEFALKGLIGLLTNHGRKLARVKLTTEEVNKEAETDDYIGMLLTGDERFEDTNRAEVPEFHCEMFLHVIIKHVLLYVNAPSQSQPVRYAVLQLLELILNQPELREQVIGQGTVAKVLVQGVVMECEDERDPRNLLLAFKVQHHALCFYAEHLQRLEDDNNEMSDGGFEPATEMANYAQVVFEAATVYFPVKFQQRDSDLADISQEQLSRALYNVLFETDEAMVRLAMPFLLDVLADPEDELSMLTAQRYISEAIITSPYKAFIAKEYSRRTFSVCLGQVTKETAPLKFLLCELWLGFVRETGAKNCRDAVESLLFMFAKSPESDDDPKAVGVQQLLLASGRGSFELYDEIVRRAFLPSLSSDHIVAEDTHAVVEFCMKFLSEGTICDEGLAGEAAECLLKLPQKDIQSALAAVVPSCAADCTVVSKAAKMAITRRWTGVVKAAYPKHAKLTLEEIIPTLKGSQAQTGDMACAVVGKVLLDHPTEAKALLDTVDVIDVARWSEWPANASDFLVDSLPDVETWPWPVIVASPIHEGSLASLASRLASDNQAMCQKVVSLVESNPRRYAGLLADLPVEMLASCLVGDWASLFTSVVLDPAAALKVLEACPESAFDTCLDSALKKDAEPVIWATVMRVGINRHREKAIELGKASITIPSLKHLLHSTTVTLDEPTKSTIVSGLHDATADRGVAMCLLSALDTADLEAYGDEPRRLMLTGLKDRGEPFIFACKLLMRLLSRPLLRADSQSIIPPLCDALDAMDCRALTSIAACQCLYRIGRMSELAELIPKDYFQRVFHSLKGPLAHHKMVVRRQATITYGVWMCAQVDGFCERQ
ncbi:mms19 nucleotide excision repair [Perkinsus chesapeaki]|uniref:MMS19 nucleotide excision repair protein n=1 Tax=Perkinsus chesapeaki TaxID=330153 RepID=A0A7J6MQS5_PERCH|nr:mms19 nucleotide excision repair [Perkinsus chesapeaki]